jgi:hypothetical protein
MGQRQRNNGLTMTTFHSRQSGNARRTRKNENTGPLNFPSHIPPSICAVMHTKHDKRGATIFKSLCKRMAVSKCFYRVEALPLVKTRFLRLANSSPKTARVPRDGHAMAAQHPARQPAKYLASCPRNVPAMAGQRQRQCRRMAGRMTRKTSCLAPDLGAPCPRRKLARRLASNLNHDIQKL